MENTEQKVGLDLAMQHKAGASLALEAEAVMAGVFSGPHTSSMGLVKEGRRAKLGYLISYWVSFVVQGIFYPIFYVGYRLAFSLSIKGKGNLRGIKGPVIFIANHIGIHDSFVFDLFTRPFSNIPPYRFMGTSKFEIMYLKVFKYLGIIEIVYKLFGVFKVNYGEGAEKALVPAYEIIKNNGTVVIFPEGKIWPRWNDTMPVGPFKWGAAFLAKNTGAIVVPVSFHQHSKNFIRDYLDVKIGEPYYVNPEMAPEKIAEEMREKVLGLYKND